MVEQKESELWSQLWVPDTPLWAGHFTSLYDPHLLNGTFVSMLVELNVTFMGMLAKCVRRRVHDEMLMLCSLGCFCEFANPQYGHRLRYSLLGAHSEAGVNTLLDTWGLFNSMYLLVISVGVGPKRFPLLSLHSLFHSLTYSFSHSLIHWHTVINCSCAPGPVLCAWLPPASFDEC